MKTLLIALTIACLFTGCAYTDREEFSGYGIRERSHIVTWFGSQGRDHGLKMRLLPVPRGQYTTEAPPEK